MSLQSKEHTRFLKSLLKNKVKFLLIDVMLRYTMGVRRNTGDLDILIEPTKENGAKLIDALKENELEIPEIKPEEFEQKLVLAFGLEPDAVDILNYTPGLDFETTFRNSIEVDFSGLKVRMIDIRDLITNKEHLNREGEKSYLDKYDVEVLKKILQKRNTE